MNILPIDNSTDLVELTRLLNKAYGKLAEQGFRFLASHQDAETTKKRLERFRGYLVRDSSRIIATICYHPPGTATGHPYYERKGVASFGQFAVDPEYQGVGIGSRLVDFVESEAIKDGAEEMVIDTAEGAAMLYNFYSKRGYSVVEYARWEVTNYRSIIMSKRFAVPIVNP